MARSGRHTGESKSTTDHSEPAKVEARRRAANSISTFLGKSTFDDLRDRAGETILNRGRTYVKRVYQLSRTRDGALVAWGSGSERYATSVHIDGEGGFEYFCSCPYSWGSGSTPSRPDQHYSGF